jgi:hypothetical protein
MAYCTNCKFCSPRLKTRDDSAKVRRGKATEASDDNWLTQEGFGGKGSSDCKARDQGSAENDSLIISLGTAPSRLCAKSIPVALAGILSGLASPHQELGNRVARKDASACRTDARKPLPR